MDLQKYALPLTVAASVAAIVVFLKTNSGGQVAPTIAAALPTPSTVPTFAAVPYAQYNVATPTPPPVQPGTGQVTYPGRAGITINKGFLGAPTDVRDIPSPNGCGGCSDTGHDYADGNSRFTWYNTVYQNSAVI